MNTIDIDDRFSTGLDGVGDTVGMEKSHWYVAIVKHNTEKSCSEKLNKLEIKHYVPIQSEIKIWKNGRRAKIDRVVIPSTIFIHCSEEERRKIVGLPFINRFMTNKAGVADGVSHKPLAIIPDKQIDILKFMLGYSETPVSITPIDFRHGDKVRVIRGGLSGLEGEVLDISKDKSELIVRLDVFGCARLTIDRINIEYQD